MAGRVIEEILEDMLRNDPMFMETSGQDFLDDPKAYVRQVLASELVNCITENVKKEAIINGKEITVSSKISDCVNVLFDPVSFGKEVIDIAQVCRMAIDETYDNERFLTFWKNILIIGGCSMLRGIFCLYIKFYLQI